VDISRAVAAASMTGEDAEDTAATPANADALARSIETAPVRRHDRLR
jgi:hypothetical protein